MKLKVSKRTGNKKSELTKLRHVGDIPAVIYTAGQVGENIIVSGSEFGAVIRSLSKGYLPTTLFELDLEGSTKRVIVKDIQYHPTTYQVLHLDFLILNDKTTVDVKVPVVFSGSSECVGVKLGGFIRQVIHHVQVRCLPKDIPTNFTLGIQALSIGESMRVGNIEMGKAVRSLIPDKEIIVVIAKR